MKCLIFIFLALAVGAAQASDQVTIAFKAKELAIDLQNLPDSLKTQLKTIDRKDPNSETELKYTGFQLSTLLEGFKEILKFKEVHHIETTALDGYKVTLKRPILEGNSTFIALRVEGAPKKGIFNKSLNTHFNWKPSYILLDPKLSKSQSSPYQVHRIEIFEHESENPVLKGLPKKLHKGAKVFIKSCSKCHNYKSFGGNKGPMMAAAVIKYTSDKKLKSFIKDPAGTLKRKVGMSPFEGNDKDLNELLPFLRYIQNQFLKGQL